jgi:hypothetical protein
LKALLLSDTARVAVLAPARGTARRRPPTAFE